MKIRFPRLIMAAAVFFLCSFIALISPENVRADEFDITSGGDYYVEDYDGGTINIKTSDNITLHKNCDNAVTVTIKVDPSAANGSLKLTRIYDTDVYYYGSEDYSLNFDGSGIVFRTPVVTSYFYMCGGQMIVATDEEAGIICTEQLYIDYTKDISVYSTNVIVQSQKTAIKMPKGKAHIINSALAITAPESGDFMEVDGKYVAVCDSSGNEAAKVVIKNPDSSTEREPAKKDKKDKKEKDDDDDDDDHDEEPAPSKQNNVKVTDGCDELRASLLGAISKAKASGTAQTVYWNKSASLPYDVMKMLQDNPNVTLVFSCTYNGIPFTLNIPGKSVVANPAIQWYGPLYLYALTTPVSPK